MTGYTATRKLSDFEVWSSWLTTQEVAERVGVSASTLRRWRTGVPAVGPPFVKLSNRRTVYAADDVREWWLRHRVNPEAVA